MKETRKTYKWEGIAMALLLIAGVAQIGMACEAGSGLVKSDGSATASVSVVHHDRVLVAKR